MTLEHALPYAHPSHFRPPISGPGEHYPDDQEALPEGAVVDGAAATRAVDDVADYVVIGSGAAGATAAVALAEQGFSVALIEEGPWVRTREFGVDMYPAMKKMFRGGGMSVSTGRSFLMMLQGRCVGGSTTINSAIAWRTPEHVLADWSGSYGLGDVITSRALEPHFEALERDLNVHAVEDSALGENNALFGVAAEKLGFEAHRIRRYDAGCEGSAGCLTGCRHGRKLGMNITYVPRALHAGSRIYTSARVEKIEHKSGRAVAVVARMAGALGRGVALRVRARRGVFVAASTIQTPNILRRSGIRPRALGMHFQAHPGVSMAGRLDRSISMDYGASQGFNSLAFQQSHRIKLESLALQPEMAAARIPGFGAELVERLADFDKLVLWACVVRAETEGTVGESFGEDRVRYSLGEPDVARARAGLRILTEMMFAAGAREVFPGVHGMPSVLTSPDQIKLWDTASLDPRAYSMMASHMFGAARMGPDAGTSVVGTDFQTHAVQGLYVVDSSIFPTNIGVNPQHSIMAISRLAATNAAASPLAPL